VVDQQERRKDERRGSKASDRRQHRDTEVEKLFQDFQATEERAGDRRAMDERRDTA
jgi:hypothetical protein